MITYQRLVEFAEEQNTLFIPVDRQLAEYLRDWTDPVRIRVEPFEDELLCRLWIDEPEPPELDAVEGFA